MNQERANSKQVRDELPHFFHELKTGQDQHRQIIPLFDQFIPARLNSTGGTPILRDD